MPSKTQFSQHPQHHPSSQSPWLEHHMIERKLQTKHPSFHNIIRALIVVDLTSHDWAPITDQADSWYPKEEYEFWLGEKRRWNENICGLEVFMYQSTPVQWIDAGMVVNCRDMDWYTKTSIHCKCMQVHSSKMRGQPCLPFPFHVTDALRISSSSCCPWYWNQCYGRSTRHLK
jgi:hypothetical protein